MEVTVPTPFIGIEAKKVDALRGVATAGKIVLELGAKLCNVGGGISNGELTVALRFAISLHVPGRGLDVRSSQGLVVHGNDFIPHEESERVIVLGEGVHHGRISIVLGLVPVGIGLRVTLVLA